MGERSSLVVYHDLHTSQTVGSTEEQDQITAFLISLPGSDGLF